MFAEFMHPIIIIPLIILALLSFFFAVAETSIISLSRIRLRHMLAKGIRRAQSIQRLTAKLDKLIAAILIGNNFVNIAMSAIITGIFVQFLGYSWGVTLATLFSAFFILILCEITPKILATKHTDRAALFSAPIMEVILKIFKPIIPIFMGLSNIILIILRVEPSKKSPIITEEELRLMIEIGREEGILSDEKRRMLHRIFEFGAIKVSQVMTPKDKIVAINKLATSEELLNIFVEEGHARLPVYDGSIDNIIGIIHARDLLYILRDKGLFLLEDLIHPVCYVAAGTKVNDLLKRFQFEKIQIGIVVDEHRKTLGLLTLEDLVEEIVGEIEEVHVKHHKKH